MRRRSFDRGDTLIEMIVAFAILSLVVVSVMMIMNRGVRSSYESVERTLVRQQMDGQAEMIRYIHDTDPVTWKNNVLTKKTTQIMSIAMSACPKPGDLPSKNAFFITKKDATSPFAVNAVTPANYRETATYAYVDQQAQQANGVWLQIADAENKTGLKDVKAYDVYIHGCWYGGSSDIPVTLGTIVRVYDEA